MENKRSVSTLTRNNWIMDASLFMTALVTILSGIYFLFIPSGGFKGGRNPWYGVTILFERETWEWLHTWIGVGMVAIVLIHIIFHWKWVVGMTRRVIAGLGGKSTTLNSRGKYNVALNATTALSFLISAISGVYFLLVGSSHGGLNPDPMFLFARTTWDVIHTWSSVLFIITFVLHFAIHWGWVVKVTKKVIGLSASSAVVKPEVVSIIGRKENTMFKKIIGITMLVGVMGLLAFGAINRTYASDEASYPLLGLVSGEEVKGIGYGNGAELNASELNGEEHLNGFGYAETEPLIASLPTGELNQAEIDMLLYMHEEEKLARDVYLVMAENWELPMFANIAAAEQSHMDSIKVLLEHYSLTDSVSLEAGNFTNAELQSLYDQLVVTGSGSLADALKVGGAVEEIDILDLKESLEQTDQEDIRIVFENLLQGSYNHLNAFASTYSVRAGVEYLPQYMTLEDYTETMIEDGGYGSGRGQGQGGQGGGRR